MGLNKRIANLGDEVLPITIEETKQRTPKPIKPEPKPEEKLSEAITSLQEEKTKHKAIENLKQEYTKRDQESNLIERLMNKLTPSFIRTLGVVSIIFFGF
ncbi:MAG TPA: hypothetical protein DHW49_07360, partial [Anaerolineae bacterium]|nr:hypothetical protein [Anaerolineae bacterium]